MIMTLVIITKVPKIVIIINLFHERMTISMITARQIMVSVQTITTATLVVLTMATATVTTAITITRAVLITMMTV